jgi:pyruvate,water dikinase
MGADAKTRSFTLPSQIADAPGTEGWESMYPYYTRFQPEDDQRFWFYNAMHFPEPMPAFDALTAEVPYEGLGAFTTRIFVFPTTMGIEHRIVNGRIYITANPVTDPEEIQRRLAIFQERAGYYYENWDKLFREWKVRLENLIHELEAIKVPKLPEFDEAEVVTQAKGVGQNHYVRESFHRAVVLENVAPPFRDVDAWLRRLHGVFRFLQEGFSGDRGPDSGAHGGRHRSADVPSRRRTEAPCEAGD